MNTRIVKRLQRTRIEPSALLDRTLVNKFDVKVQTME